MLNERLYTSKSKDSSRYFKENPEDFEAYHAGFRQQAEKWEKNPLDVFIHELSKEKYSEKTIVDLGCGEGRLEESVTAKVHSFDIGSKKPHVKIADSSNLPLESDSCDVSVFCLSLMGNSIGDYLIEATRVLKTGGLLMIAEVVSRFINVDKFLASLCKLGYKVKKSAMINDYFQIIILKKIRSPTDPEIESVQMKFSAQKMLKACIYKRR